jgi:cobaltochelatase CobN
MLLSSGAAQRMRCWLRWLLLLGVLAVSVGAQAKGPTVRVTLLPGDLDTLTAAQAVSTLRADPALASVAFDVLPSSGLDVAARQRLAAADLVLVNTVGEALVRSLGPEIQVLTRRGAKVHAVGSTWNDGLQRMGLLRDPALASYMAAGGAGNVAQMLRAALAREVPALRGLNFQPPAALPEYAAFDVEAGTSFDSVQAYQRSYLARHPERRQRAWIGLLFYRSNALSGQTATVAALARAVEARGYNPLPVYGYPTERAIEQFFIDDAGRSRVASLLALSLKIGNTPDKTVALLQKLDVAIVNVITLNSQTRAQWEASAQGLDLAERSWQVGGAEFAGALAPTVVATKERERDSATGLDIVQETPVPERVERAAARAVRWADLRTKPAADKRVALMYYNYPPGKENVGASYLNVLPHSLWSLLQRLQREGFQTEGAPATPDALFDLVKAEGVNVNTVAAGALERLVRSAKPVLLPVATYRRWFAELPPALRESMVKAWGEPGSPGVMQWKDPKGQSYFVFPVLRFGNVLMGPQPTRGWEQSPDKLYHDTTLPPHHQYLAYYLWLQREFKADAMVHVGTHATHEWLMGKEVGFTAADPGEVVAGDVPQLYPYIVDDVGEALQAKRRGMAAIISHLTPPLDTAGLDPNMKALVGKMDDYTVALQRSPAAAAAHLTEIDALARKLGVLKDVGLQRVASEEDVEHLEHYVKEVNEKLAPFGLHTFGVEPADAARLATARAVWSVDKTLSTDERAQREAATAQAIKASAQAELDAFAAGLAGRYISAGPGNDPVRNPDALPTGRNLFGFDPTRIPSQGVWAQGDKLSKDYLADWQKRHGGALPKKVVFNLWGVETARHEGLIEAEIMALMGVRPVWDARGRVTGVAVIPRAELKRPRVDVTVIPSGLSRDLFAPVMRLLDQAASAMQDAAEPDNPARANTASTTAALVAGGMDAAQAEQLARVRLYTVPSGAYGTNLDSAIPLSNTWNNEKQLADIYFMRMSHPYGQGLWGTLPGERDASAAAALRVNLLNQALKGAEAVVHSRSSTVYGALDGDDFYQYLGGTAMAIRQVNGTTPEVGVVDMSNPQAARHETLERYIGREMRSRYVNPKWMEAMLKEGYAGGRFISTVAENLWGWQVTVPEAVDASKWQGLMEAWVDDKYGLNIRNRLREGKALDTYEAMLNRMRVAIEKGHWKADAQTRQRLEQAHREVVEEVGVSCNRDTCATAELISQAERQDQRSLEQALQGPAPVIVPAAAKAMGTRATAVAPPPLTTPKPASPPDGAAKPPPAIEGREMVEMPQRSTAEPPKPAELVAQSLAGLFVLAVGLAGYVFRRWQVSAGREMRMAEEPETRWIGPFRPA